MCPNCAEFPFRETPETPPKADGRQRPLGIASLEDKIVQQAVRTVLEQVYEADFLGFSYGFRPGPSQHNARDDPQRPAWSLFDQTAVIVMAQYLKRSPRGLTVGEFWRGIGRLGGHTGPKRDGPVGWLRAWRGWQSSQLILLGAAMNEEYRSKRG